MSYGELYDYCQKQNPHISRDLIRDKVLQLTGVNRISVVKSAMEIEVCRGYFLSARNTDHQFVRQHGTHVIVLARGMNRCWDRFVYIKWDRFVYIKELMHLFDQDAEKTGTAEEFDRQLTELFGGPLTPDNASPQIISENKAFWMALGALCPESARQECKGLIDKELIDEYGIALKLRIPQQYVNRLFQENFLDIMKILRG